MQCPRLKELPVLKNAKKGWPWTKECQPFPRYTPDGKLWPRISIVMPSFNQARFIEESIRSVLLQGYPNLEFIIIDGGSTDGSLNIIRKYQKWLSYWESKKDTGGFIYGLIAAFYRKFIIKRALNYFVKKYFTKGDEVLHAGCGNGQVDTDIRDYISITGLDISPKAVELYKKTNRDHCKLLRASIFNIPLSNSSVDGIYNLGVMEHFTEPEIKKILLEFERILRPGGRMIIFWPPEFGSSVLFLKALKFLFKSILKKDIKLHPDEPTLVKSEKHIKSMINSPKLSIIDYYFGMKYFFTYTVIVAEKSK